MQDVKENISSLRQNHPIEDAGQPVLAAPRLQSCHERATPSSREGRKEIC
jgi:hypothetical protein